MWVCVCVCTRVCVRLCVCVAWWSEQVHQQWCVLCFALMSFAVFLCVSLSICSGRGLNINAPGTFKIPETECIIFSHVQKGLLMNCPLIVGTFSSLSSQYTILLGVHLDRLNIQACQIKHVHRQRGVTEPFFSQDIHRFVLYRNDLHLKCPFPPRGDQT